MKRSLLKRLIVVVIPAFVLANYMSGAWAPRAALADLGLQSTTLTCNDGTNLTLTLDTAALTALTNAISAIKLYPAGDPALTCSLSQGPPPFGGNGPKDFAVGGGQAPNLGGITSGSTLFLQDCPSTNFSLNARSTADAPPMPGQQGVGGTFNLTCSAPSGHLVSKVDCVVVGDDDTGSGGAQGSAQLTAHVTKADGIYASAAGGEIEADVLDSDMPGGTGDSLQAYPSSQCVFGSYDPFQTITHGKINVHDNPS
jgi:hypothetical protein